MSVYAALYDGYIAKAVSNDKAQKKKALKKMMKLIVKAVLKNGFPPAANNSQQIAATSDAPVPEAQQIAAPVPEITPVVPQ